jgi:hypothetical protein
MGIRKTVPVCRLPSCSSATALPICSPHTRLDVRNEQRPNRPGERVPSSAGERSQTMPSPGWCNTRARAALLALEVINLRPKGPSVRSRGG